MRESQVSAKVIADSISPNGSRITTFELEYPRFIHSEFLTHRMLSRNSASSRAIPINKMMEQVKNDPAMPMHWGVNQAGMQAKENMSGWRRNVAEMLWKSAAATAVASASTLEKFGLHKQIVNRLLEPFQRMKTVITSTSFDNFFWLRYHTDAQPEIEELAKLMYQNMQESEPRELLTGEWHIPYVNTKRNELGEITYTTCETREVLTLEEALKVSASCCAQVSYRLLDESVEKATKIYDQLITSVPVHASPVEHQAKVMDQPTNSIYKMFPGFEEGATHVDSEGNTWSGNFKGWVQNRQLIKGNTCHDYTREG